MIFGIGAATIFYITTGQCFHDINSAIVKTCCSHNSTNHDNDGSSDERQMLLEQGGPISEKKLYGS